MQDMRVGVLVPSSNTVVENDFAAFRDPRYSVHTARMFLATTTAEMEHQMLSEHAPKAARDLGSANCDVLVFACTSAGALIGIDGEERLIAELSELAGAPVLSTNAAVARKLKGLGVSKVAVFTAYVEELNSEIRKTLQDRGIEVTEIHGMGITDNFAIANIEPARIAAFVRESLTGAGHEAIFISCTNLPAIGAIEELSHEFKLPVITSNSATIDAVNEFIDQKVGR